MRIGTLTGGGDCPGLNAALRAVVKRSIQFGYSVLGIRNGWDGLVRGNVEPLTGFSVSGILPKGGTILGSSRTNPFKKEESVQKCHTNFKKYGLDAIIAIGGEDTLGVAVKLCEQGLPVVGIPKTIDNDLSATDQTFGFDTAVTIATEAIDRLHSTAEAHHRVMVVEVMGRNAGWIATYAGIAGGADAILIPERPFDIEEICALLVRRRDRGKDFSIIVVAEGAQPKDKTGPLVQDTAVDEFGHVRLGGISYLVAKEIERRIRLETRVTVLGHVQRGGTPTPFDRVLATRYGIKAVDLVQQKAWGKMAALRGNRIEATPLADAVRERRRVDDALFAVAEVFFG